MLCEGYKASWDAHQRTSGMSTIDRQRRRDGGLGVPSSSYRWVGDLVMFQASKILLLEKCFIQALVCLVDGLLF